MNVGKSERALAEEKEGGRPIQEKSEGKITLKMSKIVIKNDIFIYLKLHILHVSTCVYIYMHSYQEVSPLRLAMLLQVPLTLFQRHQYQA